MGVRFCPLSKRPTMPAAVPAQKALPARLRCVPRVREDPAGAWTGHPSCYSAAHPATGAERLPVQSGQRSADREYAWHAGRTPGCARLARQINAKRGLAEEEVSTARAREARDWPEVEWFQMRKPGKRKPLPFETEGKGSILSREKSAFFRRQLLFYSSSAHTPSVSGLAPTASHAAEMAVSTLPPTAPTAVLTPPTAVMTEPTAAASSVIELMSST